MSECETVLTESGSVYLDGPASMSVFITCASPALCPHSEHKLKKKSQSVDIPDEGYAGSLVKDLLASPLIKNVARTAISEEKEINTSNIQKARSPRRGELKRGYTIGTGWSCGKRKMDPSETVIRGEKRISSLLWT
ncbi:hypothetical protein DNTS_032041 [Danionella cerebrum]|uniref:Uncharacterized protein n=1 Tax=Danionella cerebrum TaxID=2873325 RepID=A0A553P9J1_9TELE|nr:hypothetical protein DNTS_032041 [Danionella translucida]